MEQQQQTARQPRRARWIAAAVSAVAVTVAAVVVTGSLSAVADGPSRQASPDIIGGSPASQVYPWAVSMQIDYQGDANFHVCGATLVAASWVETNAHCVTNAPASGAAAHAARTRYAAWLKAAPAVDLNDPGIWHLRLDTNNRLQGGIEDHVDAIHVYPTWDWGQPNARGEVGDIALLHLTVPVAQVAPAPLAAVRHHQNSRLIGWGITSEPDDYDGGSTPADLSQVDVPTLPARACEAGFIGTGEICVGNAANGGGPCLGDSGTGALQPHAGAWAVVGSASRIASSDADTCSAPAVYTDVAHFNDWMLRVAYGLPSGASTAGLDLAAAPH